MRTRLALVSVLISAVIAGCATTFGSGSVELASTAPRAAGVTPAADLPAPPAVTLPPPAFVPLPEIRLPSLVVPAPPVTKLPIHQVTEADLLEALMPAEPDGVAPTRSFRPAVGFARGKVQSGVGDRLAGGPSFSYRSRLASGVSSGEGSSGPNGSAGTDSAARLAELARNIEALKRLPQGRGGAEPTAPTAAASAMPAASASTALQPGMVAWNTPPKMAMGETAEVEVRVTLDEKLFSGIAGRVRAGGSTTSEAAELSRDLTAKLESTAFDVKPEGERRQMVRDGRDAVWSWVISPKLKGKQKLLLSITANVADGPSIEPLVRTIEVTAGASAAPDAISDFLLKNWEKLLTVILIPVAAWGWRAYQKRHRAVQATPLPTLPAEQVRDAA